MAKENKSGEVIEVLDDEGPEEGEIEDDTSDEDNVKNFRATSSNVSRIHTSMGTKYFQTSSTTGKEVRKKKLQTHSEEKSEKCWGNTNRRRYKFYVDHDNPSREPYDRLKKSDVNSDQRGVNFHDLLSDYKTSKHENEDSHISGNTHEKENRHYSKEVRLDSSRKRESLLNDLLSDKDKRSRKRKHRRSPSHSPVSSEPDSRKRKEIRTTRPRRRKKPNVVAHSSKESALLFAQIRASKLNLLPTETKKQTVEVINVVSEGEQPSEVSKLPGDDVKPFHSEGESHQLERNTDSEAVLEEGQPTIFPRDASACISSKGSFTASDSQAVDRIDDSESKDEDDDDVLQLRMIALQSAFRAKYLARKRLGLTKKNPTKSKSSVDRSSVDSILDDTEKLLEADLTPSQAKEPEIDMLTSLAEVPLPPDEPQNPSVSGNTQVEDLTPVDMELALTDEEDGNVEPEKEDDCDVEFPNNGVLHPIVRISHNLMIPKKIPVTVGRKLYHKVRQRSSIGKQEVCRRDNLLEVMTEGNEVDLGHLDSGFVGMENIDMYSMEIHDQAVAHIESCNDYYHNLDEECALSETSDTKSDSISAYSVQIPSLGNDNDEEDEELLRAKLLLEISKRHRKEEAAIKSAVAVTNLEENTGPTEQVNPAYLVQAEQPEITRLNSPMEISEDNSNVRAIAISPEKMKTKRVAERVRKGHLLLKAQALKSVHAKQFPITTLIKDRVSKMSNRGKYKRVNQIRTVLSRKKLDENIQVTVAGSNSKSKVVRRVPKQQDRIVICLGEDSDDSEDDKEKDMVLPQMDTVGTVVDCAGEEEKLIIEPQMDTTPQILPLGFGNQWEIAYHQMMGNEPVVHKCKFESGPVFQIKPAILDKPSSIPVDFEKSVDLFLKEVRSVQESKNIQPTSTTIMTKSGIKPTHPVAAKIIAVSKTPQAVKPSSKSLSGITPQAVRHLPFPQQEEYRRLKMQISILEMQKKRKAGVLSQVPPKSDKKVAPINGLSSSESNQPSSKSNMEESENVSRESNNPPCLQSAIVSKDKEPQGKLSEEVSGKVPVQVSVGGLDESIEDENVMREQLLRSRLRKRAAAKAEFSPPLQETESTQSFSSELNLETEDLSKPRSAEQISSLGAVNEGYSSPRLKSMLALDSEKEDLSYVENESSSVVEPDMQEKKASEVIDVASKPDKTHRTEDIAMQVSQVPVSLNTKLKDEERAAGKIVDIGSNEGVVNNLTLEGKETTEKRHASDIKVDDVNKVTDGRVLSGMRMNGRETTAVKEPNSDLVARNFAGTSERVNLHSGAFSVPRGMDFKGAQLKELEKKLISERQAALDYLRELHQLLNDMEIEGNRLREKEAAVKKLRTELSLAELSVLTHKRLMKRLALNVSTVRARVTETRHRCTLLSRACLKLGNQIKQEEIAKGGERTKYKVPSGVAELVESQLSNVLSQKKQLKKFGLPFLSSSPQFSSKGGYSVKKSGKKIVRMHPQPSLWSVSQSTSIRSNLKLGRNSQFSTSKFVKFVPASSSSLQSASTIKPTAVKESVASASTSSTNTLPVAKELAALAKSSTSMKGSSNPVATNLSANQTATKEVLVPDPNNSAVVPGPSSVAEDSVSRTSMASFILMPSDTSKRIDEEQKNSLLKEYESPLTSVSSNRMNVADNTTVNVSSSSEIIQIEESTNLDPNVMLCPYDLRGVCQDEECTYQHQRRKGAAKKS